jgi:hypothetical protein
MFVLPLHGTECRPVPHEGKDEPSGQRSALLVVGGEQSHGGSVAVTLICSDSAGIMCICCLIDYAVCMGALAPACSCAQTIVQVAATVKGGCY